MSELGGFFGWLTFVCYLLSLINQPCKLVYKKYILQMDKENDIRKVYQMLMKFLVKYHKLFGITAGSMAVAHLVLQILFERVSFVGIAATILMFLTGFMGMLVAYGHHSKILKIHRPVAYSVLIVVAVHLIFKI